MIDHNGDHTSYWLGSTDAPDYPSYHGEHKCDIAIIGGGLTGISIAAHLAEKGRKTVLLEADRLGHGTTGFTTAKITVHHGLKYHKIISQMDRESALHYYRANRLGQQKIAELVGKLKIDCDFRHDMPNYIYSTSEEETREIRKEYEALQSLEIPCELMDSIKLPFPVETAILIKDEALFHPIKYLYALAEYAKKYCDIYEHSTVLRIENGDSEAYTIRTNDGTLYAKNIVLATNFPIMNIPGFYFLKLYQDRSYIVGTKAKDIDIEGMYLSAGNPVNSFREHYTAEGNMMLVGGYGHRTGQKTNTGENYDDLKVLLKKTFPKLDEPQYLWSAQDTVTLDDIPFIGPLTSRLPGIYIATGYDKWGMTSHSVAALILASMITGIDHPVMEHEKLFSPQRFTPQASAKEFLNHGAVIVMDFIAGNLGVPGGDKDDIQNGEGKVIFSGGKSMAVYRDEGGNFTALQHHCTHMGCPLSWNDKEKSWDCPCHGSRFTTDGEILTGPALKPLEKYNLDEEEEV